MAYLGSGSKRALPVVHETWACAWEGCSIGGSVHQRKGQSLYLRHACYGHGPERDIRSEPVVYYICQRHAESFNKAHGLDDEPLWLRRARIAEDYRRRHGVAAADAPEGSYRPYF